ncbi:MAG TPA: sulfatase [Armatimonadota bacterium]|nr:sulfatase [Armatimonadota bacterium]
MTTRREALRLLGGAALCAGLGLGLPSFADSKRRPNVVFILADDLGWQDTSLYGSKFYETPNIDRLAKRGMKFTQAYAANPLCSPTRASIMTGLHPARIGITAPVCHYPQAVLQSYVPEKRPAWEKVIPCQSATRLKWKYFTLAECLKTAGYTTGHFGKWHLGPEPYDPLHQGFDVDVPHSSGAGPAGGYIAPWKFTGISGEPGEHIEDRMAEEAVKFIKKNADRPFFLNYWAWSVHSPWGAKPELIEKYKAKADPSDPQHNALYAAMVQSLDEAVGKLIQTLDDLKIADNTIIVFFSDNGGVAFDDQYGNQVTSNSPLRGGKATMYEGGTREDCIVVWPRVVKAGSSSDEIVQSIDFYPTILDMLNLKPKPGQKFDGISITPALKQKGGLDREAIFCHFPNDIPRTATLPAVYVRKGDWKLIRFFHQGENGAHTYELYNLKDDLGETRNLAGGMPSKVKELDALIERFLKDTKAVLPKPNPMYDPKAKRP